MAITHGMDVANVETLGRALQDRAQQFDQITADINRLIQDVTWLGPDADRFKGEWWPEHQGTLKAISQDLNGLGQSALNNASEQRQISEKHNSKSLEAEGPIAGSRIGGSRTIPGTDPRAIPSGSGTPDWVSDQHRPKADEMYQCADWATQRRRQLGLPVAESGNGWELAANTNKLTGTSPAIDPTFGAIASYGTGEKLPNGKTDWGHVMIVEEVLDGGNAIRVSEMNTKGQWFADRGDFSSDRVWTRQPDGTWKSPGGAIKTITFAT